MQHENKENGGQRKYSGDIYLCIYCMQLKEGGNKGGEEKEREKREKRDRKRRRGEDYLH